ncbi:hypothetical protein EV356DRAFT_151584 [Viridothelium virens]|uniref:NACHT domain-containing protein n=1 Tax=Viridothelium virens TaxID=1048519 RepID=A0A6A6H925_VIRVR|nr:hypothetical protein EV356DRAFT_151584 [Viridothelium virens]
MAEAIGLTASIITLLQVSYATTKVAYRDVHRIFGAESEIKSLSMGVSSLDQALSSINQLVVDDSQEQTLRPLLLLKRLSDVLDESKEELERIQAQLKWPATKSAVRRGWAAIQWPLKEKEIRQSLDRFKSITKSLELAMGSETISMGQETQKLVYDTKRLIEQDRQESMAKEVYDWLQRADPSTNHSTALALHEPGTGLWLPRRPEYQRFKADEKSLVWVNGILGSGKTVLCSSIIEDLLSALGPDDGALLVYFYFDFNAIRKQNVRDFLRSLLAQFIRPGQYLPRPIEDIYQRYKHQRYDLSTDDYFKTFLSVCAPYRKVYLVVDALDECAERDELLSIIEDLAIQRPSSLSMLLISRQERDIEDSLKIIANSTITIEAKAIEPDIRLYVSNELVRDKELRIFPRYIRQEIQEALVSKADGMFRWVYCQLLRLRKCKNPNAVRKQLASLPRDLDETYERVLKNIDQDDKPKARAILTWLAFSTRPLFLDQVAEIAAIEPHSRCLDKDQRLFQKALALDFCPGLVRVCEKIQTGWDRTGYSFFHDNVIRLAHFSVKEYLISQRLKESNAVFFYQNADMANREIAETCLNYLTMLNEPLVPACFMDYPLLSYAAKQWHKHFQELPHKEGKDVLLPLLLRLFLGKPQCFRNWIHVLDPWALKQHDALEDQFLRDLDEGDEVQSPLYIAARFGLKQVVERVLEEDPNIDVDAIGGVLGPPIAAAISAEDPALRTGVTEEHCEVVRILIEHGANIHAGGMMGANMLLYAFAPGNGQMMERLISAGASVNARNPEGDTLLHLAVSENYPEAAERLLQHGAELEARDNRAHS